MRLFNILLSLAQKVGAIDDYVVETGTSGIWQYRKWNSGLMEAWTRARNTFTVTTTDALGGYYGSTVINVPSGFIKDRPAGFASGYLGSGVGFAIVNRSTVTQVNVGILSNANNATMTIESLYIYGTWK